MLGEEYQSNPGAVIDVINFYSSNSRFGNPAMASRDPRFRQLPHPPTTAGPSLHSNLVRPPVINGISNISLPSTRIHPYEMRHKMNLPAGAPHRTPPPLPPPKTPIFKASRPAPASPPPTAIGTNQRTATENSVSPAPVTRPPASQVTSTPRRSSLEPGRPAAPRQTTKVSKEEAKKRIRKSIFLHYPISPLLSSGAVSQKGPFPGPRGQEAHR